MGAGTEIGRRLRLAAVDPYRERGSHEQAQLDGRLDLLQLTGDGEFDVRGLVTGSTVPSKDLAPFWTQTAIGTTEKREPTGTARLISG